MPLHHGMGHNRMRCIVSGLSATIRAFVELVAQRRIGAVPLADHLECLPIGAIFPDKGLSPWLR
jgi:hypothetical protein